MGTRDAHSCPPRPPPPARPGQRTTRSPAPAAPGARVARAQNAPGSAQNGLRQGTAFSVAAARPPPGAPSRPAHTGLPRLPRPSPVSADAGRGWAKSSHARWPPFAPVQDAPLVGTTVSEPRELRQAAKRGVRRFGAPDSRTCGNRPGLRFGIPARVPGSRPPIAAEVGGLEPSAPRVASAGQTLSRGQSSHLFVPSALARSIPQGQARE